MKSFRFALLAAAIAAVSTACERQEPANDAPAAQPTAPAEPAAPRAATTTFAPVTAPDAATAAKAACAVDTINGQLAAAGPVTVKAGSDIAFRGWAADTAKRTPASFSIVLAGDDAYGASASAGLPRADVARILESPALADAGFDVVANLGPVGVGDYFVATVQDSDSAQAACMTARRVHVR
jgi:hypothetical protein